MTAGGGMTRREMLWAIEQAMTALNKAYERIEAGSDHDDMLAWGPIILARFRVIELARAYNKKFRKDAA
jgi:hypothetical protein